MGGLYGFVAVVLVGDSYMPYFLARILVLAKEVVPHR